MSHPLHKVKLGTVVRPQYGTSAPSNGAGNVRVIGMTHLSEGRVALDDLPRALLDDAEVAELRVRRGDVLFNRTNSLDLVGKVGIVREEPLEPTVFASYLIRLICDQTAVRPGWVHACLCTPEVQLQVRRITTTGVSQANVNPTALCERVRIPLPDLPSQDRALRVLEDCERYFQDLARLIDAKQRMRDGLASELLTGRRRLRGFARRPWREIRLGEVTRESTQRNGENFGADRVMAVTKSIGLTPMRAHTMSDSLARYKVLRPGGFAYNPMRLNIGSIARSSLKHDVLVSPDYVVFEADPESLDPRFLDYTRRAHAWRRFMMAAGSGGVRIRIYYDDFARMKLRLPDKKEQSAIADILDTAFQEIACLTLLRETIAKQKRGLMQGLLTGKIRIKEDSHA